jgi:fluoroquinolone transport system permease protein
VSRLAATMRCDLRLQTRNGFYWAVAFLLVVLALVITRLPQLDWSLLAPPLVLGNLVVATFYFMAGLVLLEKSEGSLESLVVTPLRAGEYLASKVLSLIGLSLVENVTIVALACGSRFRLVPLVLGIASASALYCLVGFIAVARYESINQYLFPSMLYVAVFSLPLVHYAGLWESPLMYLHPLQASLVLLEGATRPVLLWEWIYGLAYSGLAVMVAAWWSRRVFHRFVVGGRERR